MIKRTLGGERISSGNKMKVEMSGYGRSTVDLSERHKTTMAIGVLTPIYVQIALPQDNWKINLNMDMMTKPTNGPLFGSMSAEIHFYEIPFRLYNSWLHNNKFGVGLQMEKVKLPYEVWNARNPNFGRDGVDIDNWQTHPSSINALLGYRGLGSGPANVPIVQGEVMGVPKLGYWEVAKQYYSNKQEGIMGYIHYETEIVATVISVDFRPETGNVIQLTENNDGPSGLLGRVSNVQFYYDGERPKVETLKLKVDGTWVRADEVFTSIYEGDADSIVFNVINRKYFRQTVSAWGYINDADEDDGEPPIVTFPINNIDQMRENILKMDGDVGMYWNNTYEAPYGPPLKWLANNPDPLRPFVPPMTKALEGLAVVSYKSDRFNNWLDTESIAGPNGINALTAVDTSGGSFEIEALILAKKVYTMMNRINLSGGTYIDWMEVNWASELRGLAETPMYVGGLMKQLTFQEVVSNAQAGDQPLGTIGGRGVLTQKNVGGEINIDVKEHAVIMGLASIVPNLDYTQGNAWWMNLKNMDQFHKPALDGIGFQDLPTDEMAWWDSKIAAGGEWEIHSAGKQPAWTQYKTAVNKASGLFGIENSEMWMVLARRYEYGIDGRIKDLTTLIDPAKYNYIWADARRNAMNIWASFDTKAIVRRTISTEDLPYL